MRFCLLELKDSSKVRMKFPKWAKSRVCDIERSPQLQVVNYAGKNRQIVNNARKNRLQTDIFCGIFRLLSFFNRKWKFLVTVLSLSKLQADWRTGQPTSGMGAFSPGILRLGYEGGGPHLCIAVSQGGDTSWLFGPIRIPRAVLRSSDKSPGFFSFSLVSNSFPF